MKIKIPVFLQDFWLLLTEVPGWADAPLSARLRRMLPILLPILGITLLLGWNLAWNRPQMLAEREAHAPLLALEAEIESLQLANSEQQTIELAARADQVSNLLLKPGADITSFLNSLKKEAAARGWDTSFHPGEIPPVAADSGQIVAYLPVRIKLAPAAGNADAYPSLLALLERFSSSGKRIDLMRLAIRADDNRWLSVEANLRLASPVTHEKTAQ